MNELRRLLDAERELRDLGDPFVVATVVRTLGSSYRRPGARMLFTRDRWVAGSVSGGCLERDLLARGWWRASGGEASCIRYDGRSDDELGWGLGLGCDGEVDILLEPGGGGSGSGRVDPLAFIADCHARQRRGALATVFGGDAAPVGAHVVVSDDATGGVRADAMRGEARDALLAHARRALASGRSETVAIEVGDGVLHALVEAIAPPPRLFVVGTQHDALALVRVARDVGWEVFACDATARFATRERFREAQGLLVVGPEDLRGAIDASDRAIVVVMAHDYARDRACLASLVQSRALYIGMLGPRARTARMAEELGMASLDRACTHR